MDKHECLGRARLGQGRIAEAIQLLASNHRGYLGYALGRAGRREEAEKLALTFRAPLPQILTYCGLGDKERALEALDKMTVRGPVRIGRTLNYPEVALLRGDPRVKAIRKKVGLPE